MPKSHLKVLMHLALADGEFDQKEEEFIRKMGHANGLEQDEIELLMSEAVNEPIPDLSILNDDEKFDYMYSLVQLMRVDGKLHKEEINFCVKITELLGYAEQALFEFITATYSDPRESFNKDLIKKKMQEYFSSI